MLLHLAALVVVHLSLALREHLSENAACSPHVDLNSVVLVSIEKFWRPVVPGRYVSDASLGQLESSERPLTRVTELLHLLEICMVVVVENFSAAEVTYL
jgi:hypothetical protein